MIQMHTQDQRLSFSRRYVWPGSPPRQAENYPSRPIKLLVGASAGGTTDTMARAIAQPLSASLGQPVLVENRPGAGGNLAADAVAKAAPDGYTLLVSFTSHTINATLYPKLPFDPVADFTPISKIATVPSLLVGNPKLPAQNLNELIALAKAKPDKLSIAIGGIGSSLHLAGDQFKMMAGLRILNVPYKGTAPALTDVLGGQVDMMFISLVTGTAQVQAGKLRAYGVTSAQRQPSFPDLPAIGEIVKGFESTAWFGVFGPAKLPPEITGKLNARDCRRAQRSEDARAAREAKAQRPPPAAPPTSRPSCATTSSTGRLLSNSRAQGQTEAQRLPRHYAGHAASGHGCVPKRDGRDIGERSDAGLRTAMSGHDEIDREEFMTKSSLTAAAILGVLMLSPVNAAELKVLAGGSMTASLKELGPRFEKATGHKLDITFAATPELIKMATSGAVRPRRGPGRRDEERRAPRPNSPARRPTSRASATASR